MSSTYRTKKHIALLALLLSAAGLSLASCPADLDPANCRYSITSTSVNGLGIFDLNASGSSGVAMNYDLATENLPDLFGAPYKGMPNPWNFGLDYNFYITKDGPLGSKGPLGAKGPLGKYGPVLNNGVDNTQSANVFFPQSIDAKFIYTTPSQWCGNNCYTATGPLGEAGPLTNVAYHKDMPHLNENSFDVQNAPDDYNDFPHHLDASGVWGNLGPLGPLGAMGPTGPLGPLFVPNRITSGEYLESPGSSVVKRTQKVTYHTDAQGTIYREYPLFEMYTRFQAQVMNTIYAPHTASPNDTSFGVSSADIVGANGDVYYFNSAYKQWLSIVVVPGGGDAGIDDKLNFSLWVRKPAGWEQILTANNANSLISFSMVRVNSGEKLRVIVTSVNAQSKPYNLYVTGSGYAEWKDTILPAVPKDTFGARSQKSGPNRFNTVGKHQYRQPY